MRKSRRVSDCCLSSTDVPAEQTLRRELERSRNEHRQFLETLFSAIPSPLYYKDTQGRYLGCNTAFEGLIGRPKQEILGKTAFELYPPDHASIYDAHDRRIFLENTPERYEVQVRDTAGADHYVILSKAPFTSADGQVLGLVGVVTDITVQKRLEADLRRARDEAEAANAAKTAFLTNMSHELRTPLNGIMGMTEMLLSETPDPQKAESLHIIQDACARLTAMVNDLLTLSTLISAPPAGRRADFDVREALSPLFAWLDREGGKKGLAVTTHIAREVPRAVTGDMDRFRQVVLNLLENALQFTPAGRIEVAVDIGYHAPPQGEVLLMIRVSDTGVGIAPEMRESVFEDFVLAEDILTKRFGRTGMGLSISRRLARAMGGDVTVESTPGQGSVFTFEARLPLARP
ncbi:two-component system sensor histidine kinase NtrB [Desulfolutivibrio sp.]|uniref:two-component system sensor histidine kinase NtrB n=1 Tax=Desulfolutivibrio sp. TaxID=2773296 RepID=UPI002F961CBD